MNLRRRLESKLSRRGVTARSPVNQTNHFFNLGYGWLCKHCSAEDAERKHHDHSTIARLHVGGAEEKEPSPPTLALARWTDSTHQSLTCPRCAIQEMISTG